MCILLVVVFVFLCVLCFHVFYCIGVCFSLIFILVRE